MRRMVFVGAAAAAFCALSAEPGFAQYRPPASQRENAESRDPFEEEMDLKKFRKGNFEWDTQELIRSGFLALHEENQKILQELRETKKALARLEAKNR